jgi:hypothetical protein
LKLRSCGHRRERKKREPELARPVFLQSCFGAIFAKR